MITATKLDNTLEMILISIRIYRELYFPNGDKTPIFLLIPIFLELFECSFNHDRCLLYQFIK